jgi:hypothetical protein
MPPFESVLRLQTSGNSLFPLIFNVTYAFSLLSQQYLTEEEDEEKITETIWAFYIMRHKH